MQSNQALQASMLVGREVLVPGNVASLIPGESYAGMVDLSVSSPQSLWTYSMARGSWSARSRSELTRLEHCVLAGMGLPIRVRAHRPAFTRLVESHGGTLTLMPGGTRGSKLHYSFTDHRSGGERLGGHASLRSRDVSPSVLVVEDDLSLRQACVCQDGPDHVS